VRIYRCSKVVKGGRTFSFGALVIAGDRKGQVGIGYGKANEVPPAVEKATKDARKNMFKVQLKGTTVPHTVKGRSGASTVVLAGVEARERVITHTVDFPLDGALMVGAGANLVSGGSALIIPAGLSLGRRIDPRGSTVSIVPYVQPTFAFIVGDFPSDLVFGFGVGADFRLSRVLDARVSGGLGDRPLTGVSIGAVWVH